MIYRLLSLEKEYFNEVASWCQGHACDVTLVAKKSIRVALFPEAVVDAKSNGVKYPK